MDKGKLIGFQIRSTDGDDNVPDTFDEKHLLTGAQASRWMNQEAEAKYWRIAPVYGDSTEDYDIISDDHF